MRRAARWYGRLCPGQLDALAVGLVLAAQAAAAWFLMAALMPALRWMAGVLL